MGVVLQSLFMPFCVGVMVLLVTWVADRCGPRVGGLLATLPVTSLFGIVYLLSTMPDASASASVILAGNYSVLAAFVAIPAYVGAIAVARRLPNAARVGCAAAVFFIVYLAMILAARAWLPLSGYLFLLDGLIGILLARRLLRRTTGATSASRRVARTPTECGLRFASGFLIMCLLQAAARLDPILAGALAVFPGIFAISLGIMGIRHSAEFSACAARAGILGVLAIAGFVGGFAAWIPALQRGVAGAVWGAAATACACYTFVIILLHRLNTRRRVPRAGRLGLVARAQS